MSHYYKNRVINKMEESTKVAIAPHVFSKGSITEHIYEKKILILAIIAISAFLVLMVNTIVVLKIIKIMNTKKERNSDINDTQTSFIHGEKD